MAYLTITPARNGSADGHPAGTEVPLTCSAASKTGHADQHQLAVLAAGTHATDSQLSAHSSLMSDGHSVLAPDPRSTRSGLLVLRGLVQVRNQAHKVICLVDSGAVENFVDACFAARVQLHGSPMRQSQTVALADASQQAVTHWHPALSLTIGSYADTVPAYQISLAGQWDLVLGRPWLRRLNPYIDWRYVVHSIRRQRTRPDGTREYLVHWLGFDKKHDSWSPEKDVQHTVAYQKYMSRRASRQKRGAVTRT